MTPQPPVGRLEQIPALWAGERGEAVALRDPRREHRWSDLERARGAFAAALQALGVGPGDRVMIVGENCAAMVALLFAVVSLDAWIVNVNARLSAREVQAIRAHARPRLVLFLVEGSPDAVAHAERDAVADFPDGGWGRMRRTAPDEESAPEPCEGAAEDRVASLVYTTGTTGEPKGVMLTHANVLFVARAAVALRQLRPDDHVFGVLPLSHVYGLSSVCMGSLLAGACVHLLPRFTPAALASALADQGITICQGVPAMYAKFLEHLATLGVPVRAPALRALYCGGSPLSAALKAQVEAAFGLVLHNGYGLTEAAPTVAQTRLEAPRADCSVGPLLPGIEARIVDPQAGEAPTGQVGELWVRGPNVMKGYYRDPEATRQALRPGGWLATGDLARMEPDGALHIEGRLKELIIRSGFNVFPAEVEAVLNAHPAVSQSAVVGDACDGDEEVVAFVELADGARADEAALMAHAAGLLAPYKRPARIVLLAKLPAAPSGKILKGKLREMARATSRPPAPAS